MDKKEILSKFSTDPERYYKVKLFDDENLSANHAQHASDSIGP